MKPQGGQPEVDAKGLRVAVVTSRYHEEVTAALRKGAESVFVRAGGDAASLLHAEAPGAFELVPIAAVLAARHDVDAVVALGCVLTGETAHDRFLCHAVAEGLSRTAAEHGKPVAFGVLTCLTHEQAKARAGGAKGNKGEEAMAAAISAAREIARIRGRP